MISIRHLNPVFWFRTLINLTIVPFFAKFGFVNYRKPYVYGDKKRLIIGKDASLVNTLFNTASGEITIGDGVVFGHNCMVLTGKHNFEAKDIKKLRESVSSGRDISIGAGTWVASGVIISGDVKIGKHCVICAGSVVVDDIPDYSFVAGVPAKVIRTLE